MSFSEEGMLPSAPWGGLRRASGAESSGISPLRWLGKVSFRYDAHSQGLVLVGEVFFGASFGGIWARGLAVFPTGDGARSGRSTKSACERLRGSNFWLPRVAARGCWPELVVARYFGLDTKPATLDAHASEWCAA